MKLGKRAQGLPISTIIIAALGLIVLALVGTIFYRQIVKFSTTSNECPGRCYKLNVPSGARFGLFSDKPCNSETETLYGQSSFPKNMPKVDNPDQYICDSCCVLTG